MSSKPAPPTVSWKARVPTIGMQSCRQAEQLWRCRYWKKQFSASLLTQATKA